MSADQVWLPIADSVDVGIDRAEAMRLDREGFIRLYKESVYPPPGFRAKRRWRRDAEAWADRQIAARAAA